MKYRSCHGIEDRAIHTNILGLITLKCCTGVKCSNNTPISTTDTTTLMEHHFDLCRDVISERINIDIHGQTDRVLTKGCVGCHEYTFGEWGGDPNIRSSSDIYLNLDAPCQCHCIYCNADKSSYSHHHMSQVIDILNDLGRHDTYVNDNTRWSMISGEISIHPLKDRIYEMTKDKRVMYYTNCFIYDEKIGEILRSNPNAQINFSIDCGTPETWHKIKGHDNFHQVIGNLKRYREMMTNPFQLRLKYIILPGVNDDSMNLVEVLAIMKGIGIGEAVITRCQHAYGKSQSGDRASLCGTKVLLDLIQSNSDIQVSLDHCFYDEDDLRFLNFRHHHHSDDKLVYK